jgi:hypothetical protein
MTTIDAMVEQISQETEAKKLREQQEYRAFIVRSESGETIDADEVRAIMNLPGITTTRLNSDRQTYRRRLRWAAQVIAAGEARDTLATITSEDEADAAEFSVIQTAYNRRQAARNARRGTAHDAIRLGTDAKRELQRTCTNPEAQAERQRIISRQEQCGRKSSELSGRIAEKNRVQHNLRQDPQGQQRYLASYDSRQAEIDRLKTEQTALIAELEQVNVDYETLMTDRFENPACF